MMFNTVGYLQFASGLLLLFEAFKPSELRRSIYGQFRIGGNLNEEPSRSKGESSGIVMHKNTNDEKYPLLSNNLDYYLT